ncbi:hypothetical protein HYV83_04010 [Candidatus Woesearchaeota archaeon]|nr:hypothetical protein [Candidatus Woesearchaeota archaeon]
MNVARSTEHFFQRNFSGRQFKVQLASGAVCTAARAVAAYVTYEVTDHNVPLTILATQVTSAASYMSSYVLAFYPLLNRGRYSSYLDSMKAAAGYQGIEQPPSLLTIPLASATQLGAMEFGTDPVVAAIVGSWGFNKVINLTVGMGGSNFLYKHGGMAALKGTFASLEDRLLAPAIILGHKISQYLPRF